MKQEVPTLCVPDDEKSCFGCCPPIRPPGYEHVQYKNFIRRILRENTACFDRKATDIVPITGFSCWAMGYLDRDYKLVGCLLHPAQNNGVDLRFRVAYGDKCRRESCVQATIFSALSLPEKRFWLHLADGLDSFSYSSKSINPLFHIIMWGTNILRAVYSSESPAVFTRESFRDVYPVFSSRILPRAAAYLINRIVGTDKVHLLKSEAFKKEFEDFFHELSVSLKKQLLPQQQGLFVHLLDMDHDFLDFLRLAIPVSRITLQHAISIKENVDERVEAFASNFQ